MIKRFEQIVPDSCFNRARNDEIIFVLLGRDAAAPATIRFWIAERIRLGKNRAGDLQVAEAEECAKRMEVAALRLGI